MRIIERKVWPSSNKKYLTLLGLVLISVMMLSVATFADSKKGRFMTETAIFAGGCFWCMEDAFDKLDGVISTTSGYSGGHKINPTYKEVSSGGSGHAEVIRVVYDQNKISYSKLLQEFWLNIDPTTPNRQFCDSGDQYRSAIFYLNESQKKLADDSLAVLEKTKPFKGPIATEITASTKFYPAEEYHQNYYNKNPIRYKLYKYNCGRVQRLNEIWGVRAK